MTSIIGLRSGRPQTAPTAKPQRIRSAQATRPLGRFSQLREVAEAHGSNVASVMASIKGDLVALQHKREQLLELPGTGPSLAMQSMEQQLANFSFLEADPLQTSENRCHLLEMLVQLVKVTSAEVKTTLHLGEDEPLPDQPAAHATSRISGFLDLLDSCHIIAKRKQQWQQRAEKQGISIGTHTEEVAAPPPKDTGRAMGDLDNALNEPSVSQLRHLINHQKQLQKRLGEIVSPKQSQQKSPPPKPTVPESDFVATQQELTAVKNENNELRMKVGELEVELRKLQEEYKQSTEPVGEDDFQRIATNVAFGGLDQKFLKSINLDIPLKVGAPGDLEAVMATKVGAILSDIAHGGSGSPGKGEERRSKREAGAALAVEGALWNLLRRQRAYLHQLGEYAKETTNKLSSFRVEDTAQVKNLQKTVDALNQKVQLRGGQANRALTQKEAELNAAKKRIEEVEKTLQDLTKPSERTRLVNVKGQRASAAERESALQESLAHSSQCVRDLSEKLQRQKEALVQEEAAHSVVAKERQQLLQQLSNEALKTKRLQDEVTSKTNELLESKDTIHGLKKELREKAAIEADLQQQHWKLQVELHIAQNVMNDLRLREEDLSRRATDAKKCQLALREAIEKERNDSALNFSRMEENLRVAQANEKAAKDNLRTERSRMLSNEKEIERLRGLDTQMELLEQNFTNYAASKLAQRDAQEEEEKQLQNCVEALMREPFELPNDTTQEDEVILYLESLKSAGAQMEQEERIRRHGTLTVGIHGTRDEISGKKQLVNILQLRYNRMQTFAAEQRVRQIAIEKETQRITACHNELKQEHENSLADLSTSQVQCESLVQRNTELELERTQLLRNRATAEMEIKSLKANLQRQKMHGEEQEKILIEVGTQLQSARLATQSPQADGSPKPLNHVVVED